MMTVGAGIAVACVLICIGWYAMSKRTEEVTVVDPTPVAKPAPSETRRAESPAPVKKTPSRKSAATKKTPAKTPKSRKAKSPKTYLADANGDGHTTRSEAHAAHLTISAEDTNDDGRITRSEARAARDNVYRRRLA